MANTRRNALDPMVAGMMTEGMPELMQKLVLDTRNQPTNQRPQPKMQTSLGQFALDSMNRSTGFERGLSRIAGALTGGRVKPFQTAPQQVASGIEKIGGLFTEQGTIRPEAENIYRQAGFDEQATAIRSRLAQQTAATQKQNNEKTALKEFVRARGLDNLVPLIEAGVVNTDNFKDYVPTSAGKLKDNYIVVDGQLVDLRTQEVVVDKKTTDQLNYQSIVKMNEQTGQTTVPFEEWVDRNNISPQKKLWNELKKSNPSGTPSFADWQAKQTRDIREVKRMDENGAVTSQLVDVNSNETILDLGIVELPTVEIQTLPDGRYQLFNPKTGSLGEAVDTPESAQILLDKQLATNASLIQLETNMGLVSVARELGIEENAADSFGFYTVLSNLPFATDSRELANIITTVKSELTFGKLQEMRRNSANGSSGLGQVTNVEIGLLSAAVAALDPSLGEKRFNDQLKRVEKHYANFRNSLLGVPIVPNYNDPSYASVTLLTPKEMEKTGEDNTGRYLGKIDGKWYIRNPQTGGYTLAPQ